MKKIVVIIALALVAPFAHAQNTDTTSYTNLEAIFTRPFVLDGQAGKVNTAIGGYLEGNTNYFRTDGISDGFSMEMRRFNIFLYSSLHERVKFIAELEFEHGTEEIGIEAALIDFEIDPSLVFRMGILLPPVGYFNQNHDGPKWDFIDRPMVSTSVIPSTLAEIGMGFYGKMPFGNNIFTYETYVVNGLQEGIITNESNRTLLAAGKTAEIFAEDNNGSPAVTGRVALKNLVFGEIGVSGYSGIYNTYKLDGLVVEEKRRVSLLALDFNGGIGDLRILGEAAIANIDVPASYGQQFGSKQIGMHTDLIYPIRKGRILSWNNMTLNAIVRFEYVDFNQDTFVETGANIYDDITAIVPGLSLRFSRNTLIKANYRRHWERDILGNPTLKTAGFQFGFASYF
ncbi:MAG: hypothetical protein RIG77_05675 [Cyclobacteriaceae bacterium]